MATEALALPRIPAFAETDGKNVRRRFGVGGVYVDQLDTAAAVGRIRDFVAAGDPHQVVTVNLDFLSIAQRDPKFRATINQAALAVADGMPLVWLSQLRGEP